MAKEKLSFEQQIGLRIADMRRRACMRQRDLAAHLNVTVSTISHYESGTNMPQISVLVSIAKLFGVSVDYLLGQTELRMDWQTFRRKITLMDGSEASLELVINQFLSLSEQSQADVCKLIRLFMLDDRLRSSDRRKDQDDFDQTEAEKMMSLWLDND